MVALYRELWVHFREMKHYFIASSLVFFVGIYLGANSPEFHAFLSEQVEGLGKIAQKISEKEHPQLWFFVFIFLNNAIKSILFIAAGVFLGIFPLFVLLVNGMILGYVFTSSQVSDSLLMLVVKGILPHGIIEIPAIIIACSYGVKLGMLVAKGLVSSFRPAVRGAVGQEFIRFFRLTLPLVLLLVTALFVAAVIESTVTFTLMRQ